MLITGKSNKSREKYAWCEGRDKELMIIKFILNQRNLMNI